MARRNTIQRALVLEAVKTLHCHATADEVYEEIIKEHPTISKATVYRNLNLLSEMGEITCKLCNQQQSHRKIRRNLGNKLRLSGA